VLARGKLPWSELFQPAIAAAEGGFALSPRLQSQLARDTFLPRDAAARSIFYEGGKAKPAGASIVNRQYAETLRAIANKGVDAFYRGEIARDIVRAVRSNAKPGDLTEADLEGYRALEREPLCGPYREWRVCSMAPPSAGGVAVLQILGILERTNFARAPPLSVDALHLFSEAGRLAYADRAKYLGDPAFKNVPVGRLLDPKYLDARARLIGERSMRTASPGDTEALGTSHISIVDAQGNVASMTTTIEATFGSRIMVRGFLLNNELTDFDFVPGSANEVAPGKRPRSSMAPTIVFDSQGAVRLAVGSLDVGEGPKWRAGGVLIQYVPEDDSGEQAVEAWTRTQALFETVGEDELLDLQLSSNHLLWRLFHEDGVRVFGSKPLRAFCRCSQQRIEGVLRSFGPEERADMVEPDGKIHVTCEYCSRVYAIEPAALEAMA